MTEMRRMPSASLESYGVDLVMGGHSHIYERSFLLNGLYGFSTSLTPEMLKDSGSGIAGRYRAVPEARHRTRAKPGRSVHRGRQFRLATSRSGFHPAHVF
jgi:hypothetical protein